MKLSTLLQLGFSIAMVFGVSSAWADDSQHTANYCLTDRQEVCVHLGHMIGFEVGGDAQFVVHFMIPNSPAVNLVSVDLESAASTLSQQQVQIADRGNNHFLVTDATFDVAGLWNVVLDFELDGQKYQIQIPVEIAPEN